MSAITFKHGPVTITVDGLPESVSEEAVKLELALHSLPYDDPHAAFAANFAAFGGTSTFPQVDARREFSCKSAVLGVDEFGEGTELRSEVTLYPPANDMRAPRQSDAIAAALEEERRDTQGGLPVAPECAGACVCDPACDAFAPCERLGS
jgi:hypothetical protein